MLKPLMSFDTLAIANFRTNAEYFLQLLMYYTAPNYLVYEVIDRPNCYADLNSVMGRFENTSYSEALIKPGNKTYKDLMLAAKAELLRQYKVIYSIPEQFLRAEELLNAFEEIYIAIEELSEEERSVIKLRIMISNYKSNLNKYFPFRNTEQLVAAACQHLSEILSPESFQLFEIFRKTTESLT